MLTYLILKLVFDLQIFRYEATFLPKQYKVGLDYIFFSLKKLLTNENSAKSHFGQNNFQVENRLNWPS